MLDELFAIAGTLEWSAQRLCAGRSELFFAPPGERRTRRNKREALARSYCQNCHALPACRSWARENREHGFWGGENEEQRAMMGYPPRSPSRRVVAEMGRTAYRDIGHNGLGIDSEKLAG
ncbi:MAG: WhiB family redox-sensing transcriptional regulator [Verrucomicrobiales bacterium]|jgi:WhiB family redox-sensing transcriptional regulator